MQQRSVQIWVQDQKIDLFDDEKITLSLSVQNFQDIKKVYTDFTQSFTIPATTNNNAIFSHWYENALNSGFNANYRVDANIEINHTPFRKGKLQLEEAEVKDGQVQHYKVTFYGDVKTLFDLFGEDKLKDLDYGDINFQLSGANVEDRIDGTTVDNVAFPLISSEKVWTHGDAGTYDISVGTGDKLISFSELFPALKLEKIFSIIESHYSVSLNGNFRSLPRWTSAYCWWKNRESSSGFTTEPHQLTFGDPTTSYSEDAEFQSVMTPSTNDSIVVAQNMWDETTLTGITGDPTFQSFTYGNLGAKYIKVNMDYTKDNVVDSYLDIYINGSYFDTVVLAGSSPVNPAIFVIMYPIQEYYWDNIGGGTIKFYVRDQQSTNYTNVSIKVTEATAWKNTSGITQYYTQEANYNVDNWTSSNLFDWNGTAPDIKISDFVTGIFKMFNLTCYALNANNTFQVEPLGDFYAGGDEIDITQYVDEDTITYKRPSLHKEINFEYEKSKSFLNEAYLESFGVAYGDLKEVFPFDGAKYEIKLPFEHLLFQQFTGTDIKVGYSLTKAPDYKPYIPKPVILYRQAEKDISSASFYHHDGVTANEITNYVPFGSEFTVFGFRFTNNFGQENSVEDGTPLIRSLYWTYYRPYLVNLFNSKQRIVQLKAHLPQKILNYMTLDDALIIRDKKYRINQAKLDLTGTTVDLELFQDFVSNPQNYSSDENSNLDQLEPLDPGGGTITIPIRPIKPYKPTGKGGGSVVVSAVSGSPVFLTSGDFGTTITTEKTMTITVAANTTGAYRCNNYSLTYKRADGTTLRTDYFEVCQESDSGHILTEASDNLITERFEKISEE